MKTSELKKIVEDNKCRIEFNNDWIDFYENENRIGYLSEKYKAILSIFGNCPKVIAQIILDYSYTPLEEREEEKKYRLRFPDSFVKSYLIFDKRDHNYFSGSNVKYESCENQFTQKEIDAMPFDTNFFIKEEVCEK